MLAVGNQTPWRRRSVRQVELWRLKIQPLKKWPAAQPRRMVRIWRDGGREGSYHIKLQSHRRIASMMLRSCQTSMEGCAEKYRWWL